MACEMKNKLSTMAGTLNGRIRHRATDRPAADWLIHIWVVFSLISVGFLDSVMLGGNQFAGGDPSVPRRLRYLAALIPILVALIHSRESFRLLTANRLFAAFLFFCLVFSVISSSPGWSMVQFWVYFLGILVPLSAAVLMPSRQMFQVYIYFCIYTTLLNVFLALAVPRVAVIQFGSLSVGEPGSWIGFMVSKNDLAYASAISLFVSIFGHGYAPLAARIACAIGALACLSFAGSVGGIFAVALAITCYIVVFTRSITSAASMISIGVILIYNIYETEIVNLVSELLRSFGKDTTLTGRTEIWQTGLDMLMATWPFGSGFATTRTPEFRELMIESMKYNNLHNAWLDFAVNLGAFAILPLAMIVTAVMSDVMSGATRRDPSVRVSAAVLLLLVILGNSEAMLSDVYGFLSFNMLFLLLYLAKVRLERTSLRNQGFGNDRNGDLRLRHTVSTGCDIPNRRSSSPLARAS